MHKIKIILFDSIENELSYFYLRLAFNWMNLINNRALIMNNLY